MILADSANWIDHIRAPDARLSELIDRQKLLIHPLVIGEIAMGSLRNRRTLLERLGRLPRTLLARDEDVLRLIENEGLHGTGISYVDAHLLASVRLTRGARLLIRDRRLHVQAERLGIAATP